MNVIIIEDEQLSAEHLERLLSKINPGARVVHRFESVKQSVRAFQTGVTADLIFLDIHLADGNSFEIFAQTTLEIPVIFTTAFDHYAIQAFKINSIDYLLKPVSIDELRLALNKYYKLSKQQHEELIRNMLELRSGNAYKNRFMVKLGDHIVTVKTENIHHFISEDGVVLLVNETGKRFPLDYTLDQLDPLLDPNSFFRINRKIIVHINSVQKAVSFFNSRLKVHSTHIHEEDAVVSRERVSNFKDWLNK